MFSKYTSIDDVMREKGDLVMNELNNTPLYVRAVQSLGYKQIGIFVMNNGKEKCRYVSHNDAGGRITSIEKGFLYEVPDLAVKVQEETLLEILKNVDWVKEHPWKAFWEYGVRMPPQFAPGRGKDYFQFARMVSHVNDIFGGDDLRL